MSEIKKLKVFNQEYNGFTSKAVHDEHVAEMHYDNIEKFYTNPNNATQQSYNILLDNMLSVENIETLIEATSTTNSTESTGDTIADLAGTEYENIEGFDQHIEDIVNKVGYGTREGVVAAILSLADYTQATGKRIKYLYGYDQGRQDPYNPVLGLQQESHPENGFGMDCSGVVMWAITKAGYKLVDIKTGEQIEAQTNHIYDWASNNNYVLDTIEGGQPGDLLVSLISKEERHIAMIVGTYEDETGSGYYIAEETESVDTNGEVQNGYRIFKRSYDYLTSRKYVTINMTNYYDNPSNVRQHNTYVNSNPNTINRFEEIL